MTKTIHGIVRGKTIEIAEDLSAFEGQQVKLRLTPVETTRKPGDGILRSAGVLADDPEWDQIMDEIYQARKLERRPPMDEP